MRGASGLSGVKGLRYMKIVSRYSLLNQVERTLVRFVFVALRSARE